MKIVVYGLGIIGASCAAALKKAGHSVYGRNRSREPIDYALSHGMIDGEAVSYAGADVVILALPPEATIAALEGDFPAGCIVTDICGVKRCIEAAVYSKARSFHYVGMHPMAGKETSGIRSASGELFVGKNLIITRTKETERAALETVRTLAVQMGFAKIVECSAAEHDQKIALTSQLAHIVSNAYIQSPAAEAVDGFTGGSFQDMTRVGGVDDSLWTQLYLENSDFLKEELGSFIERLSLYKAALDSGDGEELKKLLQKGNRAHRRFFREK